MEHDGTLQNTKFGGHLAEQKTRIAKSDSRYWTTKLEHPACTRGGVRVEAAAWVVRMMHQGRREYFALNTANKAAAAKKAAQIWMFLRSNGWEEALARFKPKAEKPDHVATVGEFLAAVETTGGLRPKTFADYARALRLISATIAEVPCEPGRFGPGGEPRRRWLEAVNNVSLSELNPEAVHRWKLGFLAAAGNNPSKQQSRRRSANSFVLQAKSLFAPRRLKFLNLILPTPLPFSGYEREKEGSYRYISRFSVKEVFAAAREELAQTRPEEFKALLLAVAVGLRRKEIDNLEWDAFDFVRSAVYVGVTDFLPAKTSQSVGEVTLDPLLAQEFQRYRGRATGRFVIESARIPRPDVPYTYYRCDPHFKSLLAWLRSQGVNETFPIHTLRKEFGSLINEQYDIFAASRSLRHADIGITARHYLDHRKRVTLKLAGLVNDADKDAAFPADGRGGEGVRDEAAA